MFAFIFWNIFGFDRLQKWPGARAWIDKSSIFLAQETLQHGGNTQFHEKTPFTRPARKPTDGKGRLSGGLTTYFDNGKFGTATFNRLVDESHFLCIRVSLPTFSFIIGNVYLAIHKTDSFEFVELFEIQLNSILELFPNDPVVIGGDFNCHLFAPSNRPHELYLKHLVRRLHVQHICFFPQEEIPFTYHLERAFSTIDYVFVRGFENQKFKVAEEHASVTSHRPLFLKLNIPIPPLTADVQLQTAKGAAYIRSRAKEATLRDLPTVWQGEKHNWETA